jgi:glutamine synthetase
LTLRQPTAPPFGQMLQLGILASFFRGLPTAKTSGARRVMNLPEYTSKSSSAPCRIPYVAAQGQARRSTLSQPLLSRLRRDADGRLDGIQNKIHPGDPMDKNLYDLPPEELTDVPVVCGSLREALGELRNDHAFLLKGDVFSMDQIEAYMELKWEEVYAFEHTPHPIEFQMYYSV